MKQDSLPLVIVAAVARNGAIGDGKRLLWHVRGDLRHFRALTLGKPLIMGRRTFESIGRALPGRRTIVVTRDADFHAPDIAVDHDIEAAIARAGDFARRENAEEIIVAGGGEIYAQTIARASRLCITEIDLAPAGDVRFPPIDPALWQEVRREPQPRTPRDDADFCFVDYARRLG
jgi:dihydrofolate reductase